jgi:hypothetical protein
LVIQIYINVGLFVFKILRNINFDIIAKIGCMCTTVNIKSNWTCISFDYICIKSMSYVLSIVLKSETNNVYLVFVLLNTSSHMKYISLQASPSYWNLFTMTKCIRRRMLHVFLLFNCILTVVHIKFDFYINLYALFNYFKTDIGSYLF